MLLLKVFFNIFLELIINPYLSLILMSSDPLYNEREVGFYWLGYNMWRWQWTKRIVTMVIKNFLLQRCKMMKNTAHLQMNLLLVYYSLLLLLLRFWQELIQRTPLNKGLKLFCTFYFVSFSCSCLIHLWADSCWKWNSRPNCHL